MSDYFNMLNDDEDQGSLQEKPDLDTTLQTLQSNVDGAANATIFYGLSDLNADEIGRVQEVWRGLSDEYRPKLLHQLVDVSEANFDLDYRAVGFMALTDESSLVRAASIDLLWEDESLELMNRLIDIAQWDESVLVRATAAGALGRFILLGELGDMPETETVRAQDVVVNMLSDADEDSEVQRRALEAIANCSHEIVPEAIESAYESDDPRMQASALYAMGRSYDNRWNDTVLREISNPDPAIRFEAVRASGELEIDEAVPYLTHMVQGHDREIKEVAIWALGEIGGNQAMKTLGALADEAERDEDVDLIEAIEEAIASASLAGKDLDFDFDE